MSRLLPGAPWPGLGARGFRCTAAGGDALLLGSSRCFLTTQLQVGLTPFSPAPRQRLHLCKPAAGYRGLDPDQRPSARPPGACWWPRARATSGQACPVAQIPMLGRSHSPDLPLYTPGIRARPAGTVRFPKQPGLGLAAAGPRRLTPSHQGGVDFPETAAGE